MDELEQPIQAEVVRYDEADRVGRLVVIDTSEEIRFGGTLGRHRGGRAHH